MHYLLLSLFKWPYSWEHFTFVGKFCMQCLQNKKQWNWIIHYFHLPGMMEVEEIKGVLTGNNKVCRIIKTNKDFWAFSKNLKQWFSKCGPWTPRGSARSKHYFIIILKCYLLFSLCWCLQSWYKISGGKTARILAWIKSEMPNYTSNHHILHTHTHTN